MSDMRLNTTNNVTNDAKNRNIMDAVAAEMSNSQFLDVMMSRISEMHSDDAELKALVQKVDRNKGADKADNQALLNRLKDLQKNEPVQEADGVMKKSEIKKKVTERIRQIAENHTTPVQDTQPLKALQKMAKALLEANENGELPLPAAIVQKLNDFLAKGDDFKAFDMANFMNEFNELFRGVIIPMQNAAPVVKDGVAAFEWPKEVTDAFASLGMENVLSSSADKKPDMMDVMRALKALVNESQNAATATLDANVQKALGDQKEPVLATLNIPVMDQKKSEAAADTEAETIQMPAAMTVQANTVSYTKKPAAAVVTKEEPVSLTDIAMKSAFPTKADDKKSDDTSDSAARDSKGQAKSDVQSKPSTASAQNALANEIKAAVQQPVVQTLAPASAAVAAPEASVIGLDQAGIATPAASRAAMAAELQAADRARPSTPAQQVMLQIQQKGNNKATQISVQLSPAELGRVEVRLNIQRDGQAHAVVVADKPETLALLQKDASHLERALQQAGINAEAGNMSFNLRDEREAQEFGKERKRFNRASIDDPSIQEATLNVLPQGIISDTRINYHA